MSEKLSRNFMRLELACPCCGKCKMSPLFMDRLQVLRDLYGKSLVIVSGYRCPKHNRAVRGSPRSDHLRGEAVDIRIRDKTSNELYHLRDLAFALRFSALGFGKAQFHLGLRDGPAKSWSYL